MHERNQLYIDGHWVDPATASGMTEVVNPATEKVIGDEEANRMLRDGDRGYRAPYVVPEQV